MAERILMVDDEPRILDGLRRSLRGRYRVETANSGSAGLTCITNAPEPFAVVVSDMMMPVMNGAEFLARAHQLSPDSVQIILSGQAEMSSTIAAVNDGNLFRFLTKPCEPEDLIRAFDAALAQYRLIMAERELLQQTLKSSVELLVDLMKSTSPFAASRTERLRTLVDAVTSPDAWEARMAAMLGQVGLMAIPDEVLSRIRSGEEPDAETEAIFGNHPRLAYDLIQRIPRLQRVAEWVSAQPVFAGQPAPVPAEAAQLPYAAAVAFLVEVESGVAPTAAAAALTGYPKELVDRIRHVYVSSRVRKPRNVTAKELVAGMVVDQDVATTNGLVLLRRGELLTEPMAIRLCHFAEGVGLVEPITVLV